MFYEIDKGSGFAIEPFKAIVAPRPIAWISTLSAAGVANLAPYSFFNAFSEQPCYVAFGSSGRKDSLKNIEATQEFVVNFVSEELAQSMNQTSAPVAGDEFLLTGLEKASCNLVKPPRVQHSPASLECKLFKVVELPSDDGDAHNFLVIGRVLGVHIADQFIENDRVNSAAMKLVARLGYADYATIDKTWRMKR